MADQRVKWIELRRGLGKRFLYRGTDSSLGPLLAQCLDVIEELMSNVSDLKDEVEAVTTGLLDRVTALETAGDTDFGTRAVTLSFETGEQGAMKVYFPQKVAVNRIRYFVTAALAKSSPGTVTAKDSAGVAMTGGAVSIPALSAYATEATAVPTDHNVCNANDFIQLVTAKVTPGGTVLATVEFTLTP